jgi:cell division control protein 6
MDDLFNYENNSIFTNRNVLSPHYIPQSLPFREEEVKALASTVAPALHNQRPKNVFIYGKTGTGKTSVARFVMEKFNKQAKNAMMFYINARIYNSRYRILHKILKHFYPELEKLGFGLPVFYEKLLALLNKSFFLVVVLDEIDMIRDLDDLIYTFTRINDEVEGPGGLSIVGISNKLSFKNSLDPRSKSSLYEKEFIFPPYSAEQIYAILKDRVKLGLKPERVEDSALQLISLISARETGDARYALKLLESAAEVADDRNSNLTHKEVEIARRKVELDLNAEILSTLPENHKIALFAVIRLTEKGGKYAKIFGEDQQLLTTGEVYEEYTQLCERLGRRPRSMRWFKEYLNDLETLGFLVLSLSGKGMRGHTTFIKLGVELENIKPLFEDWDN